MAVTDTGGYYNKAGRFVKYRTCTSKKQKTQQKLWQALGVVKGFGGYLWNLEHVTKAAVGKAEITTVIEQLALLKATQVLRHRLACMEEALRKEMRNIK